MSPNHYEQNNMDTPLYVDTRGGGNDVMSPMTSEEMQNGGFGNEDFFIFSLVWIHLTVNSEKNVWVSSEYFE